jgi:outer membrane receptor protein involved in Fe transport
VDVPSRGVAVTMVTKSGGDTFHGGGLVGYQSRTLQSNNIDDSLAAQGITTGNPLLSQTDQGGELGGRIVPQKVWFYGAARYRTQDQQVLAAFRPDGSPRDQYNGENILDGKLSVQLNPSNRLIGFSHWTQKFTRAQGGQFNEWGSGTDRCCPPLRSQVNKIEWQMVRKSLVTSVQFGNWKWTAPINIESMSPTVQIYTDAAHGGGRPATFDQVTQYNTGTNPSSGNFDNDRRYHATASMTWYKPDLFLGNHEFKAGFDYLNNEIGWEYYSRGPAAEYRLIFNNGAPFQIEAYNNPATPRTDAHQTAGYLRDNWVIGRRLTLNFGFRYAHDNGYIPAQCREAGQFAAAACIDKIQSRIWNSVAPRLYAAYDMANNGKTVIKGGWGRFNQVRTEDQVLPLNPFVATATTYRWHDLNGNHDYNPGEVNLDPNGPDFIRSIVRDTGNLTSSAVGNPDEKEPGIDEFALTLEHEVAGNLVVRVSGDYSHSFNEPRRLNLLRPYDSYNIAITNPDPGPDGRLGTADDPGTFITYYEYPVALAGRDFQKTILVADPRSNETHKTIELVLNKRMSNRWQVMGSYSATKNDALSPKTRGTVYHAAAALDPNTEFNTGDHTWEWLGRLSGIYLLPARVSVSANFDYRSGLPSARQVLFQGGTTIPSITLNVAPLGSLRFPNTAVTDVRAQKTFALSKRQRLTASVNVYNLLNANAVTAMTVLSGASFMKPTAILAPRIAQFSASYSF